MSGVDPVRICMELHYQMMHWPYDLILDIHTSRHGTIEMVGPLCGPEVCWLPVLHLDIGARPCFGVVDGAHFASPG